LVIMTGLIVDLDGTIVDTTAIQHFRDSRRWNDCINNVNKIILFPEIIETLLRAKEMGILIAVVTSSVSYYAKTILDCYKIPHDLMVAYHDTSKHKPDPMPVSHAIEQLHLTPVAVIGIGDSSFDAIAYNRAGIGSFGAGWSKACDTKAPWTKLLEAPHEILDYI